MKEIIYELAYLISGQLAESGALDLAKKIEEELKENSTVLSSIEPKKIRLAYSIKKQDDGYLVSVDFTSKPESLIGISQSMEKKTDVLRFITIKKSPKKPEEPREERIRIPKEPKIDEESPVAVTEKVKKEKVKKEKPVEKETKEEDLKKIEKDLDEILGS